MGHGVIELRSESVRANKQPSSQAVSFICTMEAQSVGDA